MAAMGIERRHDPHPLPAGDGRSHQISRDESDAEPVQSAGEQGGGIIYLRLTMDAGIDLAASRKNRQSPDSPRVLAYPRHSWPLKSAG